MFPPVAMNRAAFFPFPRRDSFRPTRSMYSPSSWPALRRSSSAEESMSRSRTAPKLWESARVIRPFSTKVISTEPPPRSTMSALFRFRGIFFPTARAISRASSSPSITSTRMPEARSRRLSRRSALDASRVAHVATARTVCTPWAFSNWRKRRKAASAFRMFSSRMVPLRNTSPPSRIGSRRFSRTRYGESPAVSTT